MVRSARFVIVFALLFTACGGESIYTVETVDGVRHVHNMAPLWGDEPKVELEFVQQIGGLDVDDENFLFFRHSEIAKDTAGNIYVLDSGNFRVQKYDKEWNYLATFGREGQGPGELSASTFSMDVDKTGNVLVSDANNNNVQIFAPDGTPAGSIMTEMTRNFWYFKTMGNERIAVLWRIPPRLQPGESAGNMIRILDYEGKILQEFGEYEHYDDPTLKYFVNGADLNIDPDENIYVVFHFHNRIDKYSPDGNLLFTTDRPLNYEIDNHLEEIEFQGRKLPRPNYTFVSTKVNVDYRNRIWIDTSEKQRREGDEEVKKVLDIFDEDGILLGRLKNPGGIGNIRIFGDRLYMINGRAMCISEYKIIDK